MSSYQTILTQVDEDFTPAKLDCLVALLGNSSNLFLILTQQHDEKGFVKSTLFDLLEIVKSSGLFLVNTIVVPMPVSKETFSDNVLYIVWCCINQASYYFNKDAIREKHIWKDVEWGKRAKNYNPKGKDPGNVWIPTDDDGFGNITRHKMLSLQQVIDRCLAATTKSGDKILIDIRVGFPEKESTNSSEIGLENKIDTIREKNITQSVESSIFFSSSEQMTPLERETVDLVVTSPPYWDLKDYRKNSQIGQESYSSYLQRMQSVLSECYRVLKSTGNIWINVNVRIKNGKPILIPKDIIDICKSIDLHLKDIIIWHKSSGIPTSSKKLADHFEYFLWFTKSDGYYFNPSFIKEIVDYKNEAINHGFFWNINRKAGSVGKDFVHPAIYPIELVERVINLCSPNYGTILDPFLGSGTTVLAAMRTGRNSIGFEINEEYSELIKYRINNEGFSSHFVKFSLPETDFEDIGVFRNSQ